MSCYLINSVTCYEVAKDFSGSILTAFAIVASVWIAFRQLSKQHQNTLLAQSEEAKRNTRIEMFREINILLDQSSTTIRDVHSFCFGKKFSNIEMRAEIDHVEFLDILKRFSHALLTVVSKVESHEIIHFKLFRVFRFSLQSIHHDLLALRAEGDRYKVLEEIIELTDSSLMYFGDFQVCMQNLAYGEVFQFIVPCRVPADKRYKVITNDLQQLDELHEYFWRDTNWGKNCIKYENEAKEIYPS